MRSERRDFFCFLVPWLTLTVFKLWYATVADLFGDEAFYWWESRYLAGAYSDLPPMTAWMIALSERLFGDSTLGIRGLSIIASAGIPWLVVCLARYYSENRTAWVAGLIATSIPLVGTLGLYALPDVWINLYWVMLLIALTRATRDLSWGWSSVGILIVLGLLTHLRFGVLLLSLVLIFLMDPQYRFWLKRSAPWLALLFGALGLLPLLLFDLNHEFANTGFQLVDRHPWSFQPNGLFQPLIQMIVVTPILYLLLLWVCIRVLRNESDRLLALAGALPLVLYWLVGLWADQHRTDFHWPLAGYLPLCVLLARFLKPDSQDEPVGVRRWKIWGALSAVGLSLSVTLILSFQLAQLQLDQNWGGQARKYLPENLLGWSALIDDLEPYVEESAQSTDQTKTWVIMDNFMPAAQWAYRHGDEQLAVLDHPFNHKHGRQVQLEIWGVDESVLPADDWSGLLVFEPRATPFRDRSARINELCSQFDLKWISELSYLRGQKRFQIFQAQPSQTGQCDRPAFGYLDQPVEGDKIKGRVKMSGWAVSEDSPVTRIIVSLNDSAIGELDYGQEHLGVTGVFPDVRDPNAPNFGFSGSIDLGAYPPGEVILSVTIETQDGRSTLIDSIAITLDGD